MRLTLIIFLMFLFTFSGCKKCMHCSTICYVCKGLALDTICSGPSISVAGVNTLVKDQRNLGSTCNQIQTSLHFDDCNATQDSLSQWSNEGYVCTTK